MSIKDLYYIMHNEELNFKQRYSALLLHTWMTKEKRESDFIKVTNNLFLKK